MAKSKFVVEPSNGYWGILKEGSEDSLLKILRAKPKPNKHYRGVHSIILNTTNQCNMDCIYCSAHKNGVEQKMDMAIVRKTIDEAVKMELTPRIIFHGSEPLLNFPLIVSAVEYGEAKEREVLFYLQSNLTALTDAKLDFIRQHKIGVSTSIDGFKEQHNATRPFRNGLPTYDLIVANIKRILEFQKGMSTATVVTKYNVGNMSEIALDLEEKGITHLQFLPVVRCQDCNEDYRPLNKDLTEGYIKLFEQTFNRLESGQQRAVIKNISQLFSAMFVRTGVDNCRICSSADYHPILAVDINGDVYPCDYFFGDRKYKTGNILTEGFDAMINNPCNLRSKSIEDTTCADCNVRMICGGGCMTDKLFSGGTPYYCETYRNMFNYLGSKIPDLREKGLIGKLL